MTESFPRPTGVATYTQTHGGDLKVGDTVKRFPIGSLDFWKVVEVKPIEIVVQGEAIGRIRLEHRPMPGEQTKAPLDLSVPFGDREWSVVKYTPLSDYQPIVEGDGPLRVVVNGKTQMTPSRIAPAPEPMVGPGPSGASDVTQSGRCRGCGGELVQVPGRTYHPWNVDTSSCPERIPIGNTGSFSGDVPMEAFVAPLHSPSDRFALDDTGLGRIIWETSQVFAVSISTTGASIIARALLAKFDIYPKGA